MKLAKKLLGIAAIFAVIVFMALPLTGCPEEEDPPPPPPPAEKTQPQIKYTGSFEDLEDWLSEQQPNTPETTFIIKLTNLTGGSITDLSNLTKDSGSFYIYFDLSDINDVTTIGSGAFQNCSKLTGITLPNTVTSIESQAFLSCTSLTSVTIGSGTTNIINNVFNGCTSLTGITVDKNNPNYASVDGILYNKGKTGIIFIPQKITGKVTIPDTVTSIEFGAFSNRTSLTSVTIGSGTTNINNNAFDGCTSLTGITVDKNNPSYASVDGILYDKGKTQFIFIPQKITGNVTIPDTITSIGNYAFRYCSITGSITLPNVTSIGEYAFQNCSITGITLPKVTTIGQWAFSGCSSLTGTINLPNVTSIDNQAFDHCSSLTGVTIPKVTTIGWGAFQNCSSLTSIILPNTLTSSISSGTFLECSSLTAITIPIQIYDNVLQGCTNLTSVTFEGTGKITYSGTFYDPSLFDLIQKYDGAGTYTRAGSGTTESPYVWTKKE